MHACLGVAAAEVGEDDSVGAHSRSHAQGLFRGAVPFLSRLRVQRWLKRGLVDQQRAAAARVLHHACQLMAPYFGFWVPLKVRKPVEESHFTSLSVTPRVSGRHWQKSGTERPHSLIDSWNSDCNSESHLNLQIRITQYKICLSLKRLLEAALPAGGGRGESRRCRPGSNRRCGA